MPIGDMADGCFKMIDILAMMDIIHLHRPLISSKFTKMLMFEESNIPHQMKEWAADLGCFESFVKPDQLTEDSISDQIPRANGAPPPLPASAVSYG